MLNSVRIFEVAHFSCFAVQACCEILAFQLQLVGFRGKEGKTLPLPVFLMENVDGRELYSISQEEAATGHEKRESLS